MKYFSVNEPENFDFLGVFVYETYIEGKDMYWTMKSVLARKNTPQNPENIDMEMSPAEVVLKNFRIESVSFVEYEYIKPPMMSGRPIKVPERKLTKEQSDELIFKLSLMYRFAVLVFFESEKTDDGFMLEFELRCVGKSAPVSIKVFCSEFDISWDRFIGPIE